MSGPILLDANILVLLAVGTASRDYISSHKNTAGQFKPVDFDVVGEIIACFSEIIVVPHVVAEASSLVRQIGGARRTVVTEALGRLVSLVLEVPVASLEGIARDEHRDFGITDAVLLHLCGLRFGDASPTLLTVDEPLANRAASLGYGVIDYRRDWQAG